MKKINKKTYVNFLSYFKKIGYKFVNYKKFKSKKNIILRHDVDFSLEYAIEIAKLNKKNKIKAHFFILVDSPFYNISEEKNIRIINQIIKLDHIIGLHYNPSDLSFKSQFEILKQVCPKAQKIFSIHKFGSNKNNLRSSQFINLYDKKFTKKYFADSGGKFRFGSPINDKNIINDKSSFQLNLHPIWWYNKNLDQKRIFKDLIDNCNNIKLNSLSNYKLIKL